MTSQLAECRRTHNVTHKGREGAVVGSSQHDRTNNVNNRQTLQKTIYTELCLSRQLLPFRLFEQHTVHVNCPLFFCYPNRRNRKTYAGAINIIPLSSKVCSLCDGLLTRPLLHEPRQGHGIPATDKQHAKQVTNHKNKPNKTN